MTKIQSIAVTGLLFLVNTTVLAATSYTYDELNRLTKVVYDDGRSISYSYDAAGNLLTTRHDAGLGWCGQTLDFTNNLIPSNWRSQLIRSGPGLRNNRLEASPTDSGALVYSTDMPMASGVKEVVVDFDNERSYSVWGQFNNIEFKTATGRYWMFGDGNFQYRAGSREFTSYQSTTSWYSGVAGTTQYLQQLSRPMGFGVFKTRLVLRDGSAAWSITNSAGQVTSVSMALAAEFKVADLVGMMAGVYTTTNGAAWIDNVAIQCRP